MKLTLKIENFDYLPDGGPMEIAVNARGLEVGRDSAMDWTLPDPMRHISSRHFEVAWRDRQFWLSDLSTNGTFSYGQSMRISSPYLLTHNERLQVGHYIIRVLIEDPALGFAPPPASPGFGFAPDPVEMPVEAPTSDPWSVGPASGSAPSRLPPPMRPPTPLSGQFGDSFVDAPRARAMPEAGPVAMPQVSPDAPAFPAFPATPNRPAPGPFAPPAAPPQPMPPAAYPLAAPSNEPFLGGMAGPLPSVAMPIALPVAGPPPVAPRTAGGDGSVLLDAICKGAGLPPGSLAQGDVTRLGEEIGRCLRIATEEMMALLGARAAAKQFVKSASRTMIGGMNNSPLKFKPNAVEALTTMFVNRPESFLSATVAFQSGFDDVKRHQTAVYAAMQPALARLLEDLSPEAIEGRATAGVMTSKKTRAWETYVERWDAKTHPYENGMLDVFLAYFADAYDDAVKKTGG